jgi:GxxExxY protein
MVAGARFSGDTAGQVKESLLQCPAMSSENLWWPVRGIGWRVVAKPVNSGVPLSDDELTYQTIGCSRWVYDELGPGLLESSYAGAFAEACKARRLRVEREVPAPLFFNGVSVATYRLDLIIEGRIIVELKSRKELDRGHLKQVFHYLRVTDYELGLLFNFGPSLTVKRFTLRNAAKYRRRTG